MMPTAGETATAAGLHNTCLVTIVLYRIVYQLHPRRPKDGKNYRQNGRSIIAVSNNDEAQTCIIYPHCYITHYTSILYHTCPVSHMSYITHYTSILYHTCPVSHMYSSHVPHIIRVLYQTSYICPVPHIIHLS